MKWVRTVDGDYLNVGYIERLCVEGQREGAYRVEAVLRSGSIAKIYDKVQTKMLADTMMTNLLELARMDNDHNIIF